MKLASIWLLRIPAGKCFLFIFILLINLASLTFSQNIEPRFEHLSVKDGLPERTVKAILQDYLGYMWFCTQYGLVRYDGYEMTVFGYSGDSTGLTGMSGMSLYEDRDKNLWIGSWASGLNRFNRATETFKHYVNNPDDSLSISSGRVYSMYEDRKGRFWVGNDEGLDLLDRRSDSFKRFCFSDRSYSKGIYDYLLKQNGNNRKVESILKVGNNADITKKFIVKKNTPVLIVMIGEAGYDYGWLEDSKGNILFNYDYKKTQHAGGAFSNRVQAELVMLTEGTYKLRFTSNYFCSYEDQYQRDNSADYKMRTGKPPDFPEYWGIQILDVSGDVQKIKELIKNISVVKVNSKVFSIIENETTGQIYVGTNSPGLYELNENLNVIEKSDLPFKSNSKREIGSIESFCKARDGNIWIATTVGLCKFDPSNKNLNFYQPTLSSKDIIANHLNSLVEDKEGNIWGGTVNNGLFKFNIKEKKFYGYENNPNDPYSISSNKVLCVSFDRSGILWTGLRRTGISKWDRNKWKFQLYDALRERNILNNKTITTIYEDKNKNLWLGTFEGLYKCGSNREPLKRFSHDVNNSNSLCSDTVVYVIGDNFNSSILWIGTNNGLDQLNTQSEDFVHYYFKSGDSTSLYNNSVTHLLVDHEGILWVGTNGGVNRFDRKTGKFMRYTSYNQAKGLYGSSAMKFIYEDHSQKLWIGYMGVGLLQFDRESESFKSYISDITVDYVLGIQTIDEDKMGNLCLGSFTQGLYLFDRVKEVVTDQFTTENGLIDNKVLAMVADDSGNLWLTNHSGLTQFNPKTRIFKHYNKSEGLADMTDATFYPLYYGVGGQIFFCGQNGFNVFYPNDIVDDSTPPQVVIKKVSLFNRPDEKIEYDGFISELKVLSLPYHKNDLGFLYVGLHYGEPLKNQYKYILEGYDKNWIDAGNQRTATYTNLDPGEYVFRVKASNRDGVWNDKSASIKIIINPPLWATTWAYMFYVLVFISLIYITWKLQLKRIRVKQEVEMSRFEAKKLHEVDEMKSRFFANISHEFRTPLTLILGPAKDIIEKSKDIETKQNAGLIKRSANRLLALVNQLLDLSKLEAGKMKLETREQNIIPLLKGLVLSFSSLAERKKITLSFNTKEEKIILYLDKDKMEKIVNNLLSNAFKFTPESGKIDFTVEKLTNELELRISDSGQGISKEDFDNIFDRFYQIDGSQTREQEGTGIGLALTKELVELHKGKIRVESEKGKGTTFIVRMPLGKDHLKPEEIILAKTETIVQSPKEDFELITETTNKKENTEIDVLLDSDRPLLLVVEDNSDVRKYIISHLEANYRIQEAIDGEDGLDQAFNHIPDLIISDVMMPKMDGFELCNKLKTDERTSHIPIIMLTAKATSQDKISGYETGADDYIMKPFDAAELKVRIKNLIEIRRKLQEKFRSDDFRIPKELSSIDEQFIKRVLNVIKEHISEEEFSIEELGIEAGMSRGHMFKKIKALTGKSPSLFLRSVRLAKAKKMIKDKQGNISEISFSVGFNSPAYFTKCFSEEFGYLPSDVPKS